MSYKDRLFQIAGSFDNTNYDTIVYKQLEKALKDEYQTDVDAEFIMNKLQEAYSNGFQGFHFLSQTYEYPIQKFLTKTFGDESKYILTRICGHKKVYLFLDLPALGLQTKDIPSSFQLLENGKMEKYVDFCYN